MLGHLDPRHLEGGVRPLSCALVTGAAVFVAPAVEAVHQRVGAPRLLPALVAWTGLAAAVLLSVGSLKMGQTAGITAATRDPYTSGTCRVCGRSTL